MRIHWTQETIAQEEVISLTGNNVSAALMERLRARIARRNGRPRRHKPDYRQQERAVAPIWPEAA